MRPLALILAGLLLGPAFVSSAIGQRSGRELLKAGQEALRRGDSAMAEASWQAAIRMDSRLDSAYYALARLLWSRNPERHRREARRLLDRALRLQPDNLTYRLLELEIRAFEAERAGLQVLADGRLRLLLKRIEELGGYNTAPVQYALGMLQLRAWRRLHNAYETAPEPLEERIRGMGASSLRAAFDPEFWHARRQRVLRLQSAAEEARRAAIAHLETALQLDSLYRDAYLALGRLHLEARDLSGAASVFERFSRNLPADGLAWLGIGVVRHFQKRFAEAEDAFRGALTLLDAETRRALQDISLLREPDAPPEDPERFWVQQDPFLLTAHNERQLEHYARVGYATLVYTTPRSGVPGWKTDRGRLVIRYGLPLREVLQRPQLEGGYQPAYLFWDYGSFALAFEERLGGDGFVLFAPKAGDDPEVIRWLNMPALEAELRRKMPSTYRLIPAGGLFELTHRVYYFRSDSGATEVVHLYGIPIRLRPGQREVSHIPGAVFRLGFFLEDSLGRRRYTYQERMRRLPTDQLRIVDGRSLWVGISPHSVPPGTYRAAFELYDETLQMAGIEHGPLSVPRFSDDQLAISSLLLAEQVSEEPLGGPVWHRSPYWILPAIGERFQRHHPLYVYWEVYGLQPDERGRYEVEVEYTILEQVGSSSEAPDRPPGRQGARISARLPVSFPQPTGRYYVTLDLASLPAGAYVLLLHLRDSKGREAHARTRFLLQ